MVLSTNGLATFSESQCRSGSGGAKDNFTKQCIGWSNSPRVALTQTRVVLMATSTYTIGLASSNVLLRPTKRSFLLLLPLLPPVHHPPKVVTLPAETWFRCIDFAMDLSRDIHPGMSPLEREKLERCRRDVVRVCKSFKVGTEIQEFRSMSWLIQVAFIESWNTDPILPCHAA